MIEDRKAKKMEFSRKKIQQKPIIADNDDPNIDIEVDDPVEDSSEEESTEEESSEEESSEEEDEESS